MQKTEAEILNSLLSEVLEFIDAEKLGAEYKTAASREEKIKAAAKYFRKKTVPVESGLSAKGEYSLEIADKASEGYMREINIDWHFENGDIDFLFDPTSVIPPTNHEWLWQFNRHYYWGDMASAYIDTKNEKYAKAFQKQLRLWLTQCDEIPQNYNGPGSVWRTIECGLRLLGSWQQAFDGFKNSPDLEDEWLLAMIAAMHKQTVHLINHPTGKNWILMESNGVYAFTSLFPEFTDADANREIAVNRLLTEEKKQALPDGMHNELSPDYQSVAYGCGSNTIRLARAFGREDTLPKEFRDIILNMALAAIKLATPNFTQPRTNDCFTIPTANFTKRGVFDDLPECVFVNTNRKEGKPLDETSVFLSYAGFAVMRSDWSEDAAYMCFDVGPLGLAHVHQDKLNINLYKGAEELIFDDGGGQYEISKERDYGLSAFDHNTVLVDGMGQNRKTPESVSESIDAGWITNDDMDFAFGEYTDEFDGGKKPATHRREVTFYKPDFYRVTDILTSTDEKEHTFEQLFQIDTVNFEKPDKYANAIMSDFGKKYDVLLVAIDKDEAKYNVTVGQTEPVIRGMYIGRNDKKNHPSGTVSRLSKKTMLQKFDTLVFPICKKTDALPEIALENGKVTVQFKGKYTEFVL